tara:strand:- start:4001 stop:4417 length:417 start_codon:yes stop_codon:yes gene_type:complete
VSKILGIDYGLKRIGISIADSEQRIAFGLTTINTNDFDQFISKFLKENDVSSIIIGNPVNLDGTNTDCSNHAKGFAKRLENQFPAISFHFIDERFTSKMARKAILYSGIKKSKRRDKKIVDKVSATILLQDYFYSDKK